MKKHFFPLLRFMMKEIAHLKVSLVTWVRAVPLPILIGLSVICIVGVIGTLLLFQSRTEQKTISDLTAHEGWKRFAGATSTPEGLRVLPLGRYIIHQDGSAPQPNPPVSLLGPRLKVTGNFTMLATLSDIDSSATLRLYGELPFVYDEWRHEGPSIELLFATSSSAIRVWDGSASTAIDIREFTLAITNPLIVSLEHRDGTFVLTINNHRITSIPDHNVFKKEDLWFGLDAGSGGGFLLSSLNVLPGPGGSVMNDPPRVWDVTRSSADNSLRNVRQSRAKKIHLGAAVSVGPMLTDDEYREIVAREFTMITPENGLKPQFVHPREDTYVFGDMDTLIDVAIRNELVVHGHVLVYHKSSPGWMNELPKEKRRAAMVEHISTVAEHFRGRVMEWDVVNEPFSNKKAPYKNNGNGLERTIWYEAMGEEYIDLAFKTARAADPKAILYLNDYGLERDGERWDALLRLVKRLKERGVPIDGIGFESHIYGDGDYSDADVLKRHFDELGALGLKVRISEIDVTGDDAEQQLAQYVLALDVCLRSPNCTAYSTWGITDLYGSTTRSDRYPLVYGTSLLWDTKLKPKPAYSALKQRLNQGK